MPVYDFHTHTFLSDGVLSPMELIRRAYDKGYRVIGITDHVGLASQERVVSVLVEECSRAMASWDIIAIPGVEITHVPIEAIPESAERAKSLGAKVVIVHGETIVEPVESGTNLSGLNSPNVDILAHPGLITSEVANIAAHRGVYLELSARRGHSLTNGNVVRKSQESGAALILNSDAHHPDDLLSEDLARQIGLGAGVEYSQLDTLLETNPKILLGKLGISLS